LTVFPNVLEAFISAYDDQPWEAQIDEPVLDEIQERLLRIPYFAEVYAEDGIAPEDFVHHSTLEITGASFSEAMTDIEAFATEAVPGRG
jgi:transaldolase